jgi:PleD family two-component response regulator
MLTLKRVSGRLRELLLGRAQTGAVADRAEQGSTKLLVVDDEESICFSMREYFSQHGFKVDTARELEEA